MIVVLLDLILMALYYHNTMHLESSAAHAPQYVMPMNFYGQKTAEQYHAHGAVGPVSQTGQTGHGGPVLEL